MSLTAFKCPSCASAIQEADLDLTRGLAKCSYCGSVMNLTASFGGGSREGQGRREPVALPKRMTFAKTLHGIEITRSWYTHVVWGLVIFCLFWDGFLVFWYATAFATDAPTPALLFPLIHVTVGLFLSYYVVASFVNTTRVAVERGMVRISHGPVPWPGGRELAGMNLRQLFCKEHISRSKNGVTVTYQLWALHEDGSTKTKLLANMELEQALFFEQELEKALGIQDRPQPGEVSGRLG